MGINVSGCSSLDSVVGTGAVSCPYVANHIRCCWDGVYSHVPSGAAQAAAVVDTCTQWFVEGRSNHVMEADMEDEIPETRST